MKKYLLSAALATALLITIPKISGAALLGNAYPGYQAEPLFHNSFVRDGKHKIAFTDVDYANALKNWKGASVDVVMQQCFGGGFLNDIAGSGISHTFTSASDWYEPALNYQVPSPTLANPNPTPTYVENFTRAWRDANYPFGSTMLKSYNTAVNGTAVFPVVPKDASASNLGPDAGNTEHPQYESSGVISDNRSPGANTFAILVAWSNPDARHAQNIARVFNMLTTGYGLNKNNIVILYENNARGSTLGPWLNGVGPSDIGGLVNKGRPDQAYFVDGDNSKANFLSALNGTVRNGDGSNGGLFTGSAPGAGDRLLIYNTGHGSHMATVPFFGKFQINGTGPGTRYTALKDGLITALNGDPVIDSSLVDTDGNVLVQLSMDHNLGSALNVGVNGVSGFSFNMVFGDDEYDLTDIVDPGHYSYQARIPIALLNGDPAYATFDINEADYYNDHLLAVDYVTGEQEYLVAVPEPGSYVALLTGLFGMAGIMRRTRKAS